MSIEKAYNSWAEQYDSNNNRTRDLDAHATISVLSRYDFRSVLELGCGTGKNTGWLLENAHEVIGLDFSGEMLNKAKEKINSPRVQFEKADLKKPWNVEDASADLVTSSLTLEHIEDLDHIFDQARSKLKSNGLFFICELHPFKQYLGSKAKFETEKGTQELETYTHNISEYVKAAEACDFKMLELKEWFDEDSEKEIPRLISFVFDVG
ncbi:MAG: class I SAM-dependent methyltransferase [Crocinitomicaceae bacterium]